MKHEIRFVATVTLAVAAVLAIGQSPTFNRLSRSVAKPEAVEVLYPEQVSVLSGKASAVALHFRIAQGLHINSHTPKDVYLIPTAFSIPEASGVRLDEANYPAGADFTLPADPGTKLSVYTGEFTIQAK